MRLRPVLIAVAAGLVLADASVVTLALPELLHELDTTIEGVAAVIGVYTVVLCAAVIPAWRLAERAGYRRVGVAGFTLFAAASFVCARAETLTGLLAGRGAQAVGGAAGLLAAFAILHAAERPRRLWLAATVLGAAIGPALGGALTQAFDWRAIFEVQVPLALLGAVAVFRTSSRPRAAPRSVTPARSAAAPAAALAFVSAALTGVLFLLILLLVAGWNLRPLAAAGIVTALPVGALAGSRLRAGGPRARALAGCLLVGGGVLALAWLPDANAWWTVVPQLMAGVGMGMSLPALAGELLPERTARDAAVLLTVRHAGIGLALALIAPIAAARLDETVRDARLQGVAVVLDAKLSPQDKIRLAPDLFESLDARQPRTALKGSIADNRSGFAGKELIAYNRLGKQTDDVLVNALSRAFKPAFLIAGAFALLAAGSLALRLRPRAGVVAAAVAATGMPAGYALAQREVAARPVVLADPCAERTLADTGGLSGRLQNAVLKQLDSIACEQGSSREELVLALADPVEAESYERKYGVNPRSLGGAVELLLR